MSDLVRIEPYVGRPRYIAAADVSFNRYSPRVFAPFVVLKMETLAVMAKSGTVMEVGFPYVPGFLSFREIPPLIEAWKNLGLEPDVVVMDGQGIAHPRRMGIATHMGLLINKPSIGCAKSLLVVHYTGLREDAGETVPLMDRGEPVGVAFRKKTRTNPVYMSPGHRMDAECSVRILAECIRGHRISESTRQAHLFVNELRRAHVDEFVSPDDVSNEFALR